VGRGIEQDDRGSSSAGFAVGAVAVALAAAVLRFWALDTGLPNLHTRPDEAPVVLQTGRVARGQVDLPYATYPHAYVYLSWSWGAASSRLTGGGSYLDLLRTQRDRAHLAGRALSAAAGVASVLLLVQLVRRELGDGPALASGFLLAVNHLLVRDAHAMKPDSLVTLGGILALAAMLPMARDATLRRAAVAGLAVGISIGMKWSALVLLAPLYAAGVLGSSGRGRRRLFAPAAIVGGAVAVATFAATSPYLFLDAGNLNRVASGFQMVLPWLPGTPPTTGPHSSSGEDFEDSLSEHGVDPQPLSPVGFAKMLTYHATFSLRYGCGLLGTLLLPFALAWGLTNRRPLPTLAAVYLVAHIVAASLGNQAFARYLSPIIPCVVLLEVGLLSAILAKVAPRHVPIGLALATALLAAEPLARSRDFDRIASRTDTRELATRWMANLERAPVMVVPGFWSWGRPRLPAHLDLRGTGNLDPEQMERDGVRYLVTHEHPLPFSNVDEEDLASVGDRLTLLADFDPFTQQKDIAVFERADAYYVPWGGFAGVERPGPRIRIYAFE
jgi:4-amino-4-deoxy-L-arabinose transferase-like glycosyltransferase